VAEDFCMTKPIVFSLAKLLELMVENKDTKYRLAWCIKVACILGGVTMWEVYISRVTKGIFFGGYFDRGN